MSIIRTLAVSEERHGSGNDAQGNQTRSSETFGGNGNFGSHAPYGDGPKVH